MICNNCGNEVSNQTRFCDKCGSPMVAQTQPLEKKDMETIDNTVILMLSYLGILFFLPLVVCPDSKTGRFHANLVLLIASGACSVLILILSAILMAIHWRLWFIGSLLNTALFITWLYMVIYGMKNVKAGEEKPLPYIGDISIIK